MTLEGFWQRVNKTDGCWLWIAGTNNAGYGRARFPNRGYKMESAHRVSYELHNGAIPEGSLVLHKCDVRLCVRPDHLFLGTPKDNAQDCISKGRNPKPRQLTEGEYLAWKEMRRFMPKHKAAREMDCSEPTMNRMVAEFLDSHPLHNSNS